MKKRDVSHILFVRVAQQFISHSICSRSTRSLRTNAPDARYTLLKGTPPSGERFAEAVKRIMESEKVWVAWKNQGCPDFFREGVELRKRKADEGVTKVRQVTPLPLPPVYLPFF